jgi:hypothetical protein
MQGLQWKRHVCAMRLHMQGRAVLERMRRNVEWILRSMHAILSEWAVSERMRRDFNWHLLTMSTHMREQ